MIEKSFKASGIFDVSVPMRVNPSIIDHSKLEPAKLRRYAQMKKKQEEKAGTSKVTTTVNIELEKFTVSVTVSPRNFFGSKSKLLKTYFTQSSSPTYYQFQE